jgi:uncharacterized protein with GYD domain
VLALKSAERHVAIARRWLVVRYVAFFSWTDQGIRNVKDTVKRVREARDAFKGMGVTIESIYWTEGKYDLVGVLSAADEQMVSAAALRVAGAGNVRTRLARAFDEQEMTQILQKAG